MNDYQLKYAKQQLFQQLRNAYGNDANIYHCENKLFTNKHCELQAIDMINSILAYNNFKTLGLTAEDIVSNEEQSKYNYLQKYIDVLGRDAIVYLVQQQMNDIDYVKEGIYTDCDGLSYNQIIWRQ